MILSRTNLLGVRTCIKQKQELNSAYTLFWVLSIHSWDCLVRMRRTLLCVNVLLCNDFKKSPSGIVCSGRHANILKCCGVNIEYKPVVDVSPFILRVKLHTMIGYNVKFCFIFKLYIKKNVQRSSYGYFQVICFYEECKNIIYQSIVIVGFIWKKWQS